MDRHNKIRGRIANIGYDLIGSILVVGCICFNLTRVLLYRIRHPHILNDLISFIQTGQPKPQKSIGSRWHFIEPGKLLLDYSDGTSSIIAINLNEPLVNGLISYIYVTYKTSFRSENQQLNSRLNNIEVWSAGGGVSGTFYFVNDCSVDENLSMLATEIDNFQQLESQSR